MALPSSCATSSGVCTRRSPKLARRSRPVMETLLHTPPRSGTFPRMRGALKEVGLAGWAKAAADAVPRARAPPIAQAMSSDFIFIARLLQLRLRATRRPKDAAGVFVWRQHISPWNIRHLSRKGADQPFLR